MVARHLSLCNYLWLFGLFSRETSITQLLCYPKGNFRTKTAKSPFKFHQVSFTEVEAASCSYYFSDISVLPFCLFCYLISN